MSRQDQKVESDGLAIQGGRDVVVNLGPTGEEFAQLMVEMGKQLAGFHAEGQAKVEQRLEQFKIEVLKEFANGNAAAPEALKDPDFQAVLGDAQKNFVRNDDEEIAASLINLISERSQQAQRTRVSLSLNAAIEVMGSLTSEDIATLSALFHSKRAIAITSDTSLVFSYLARHIGPHIPRLPSNSGSLEYLVSKGCLTFNQFSNTTLQEFIRQAYGCAFSNDFEISEISEAIPKVSVAEIMPLLSPTPSPIIRGFSTQASVAGSSPLRFRFVGPNPAALKNEAEKRGLSEHSIALQNFASGKCWPVEQVAELMSKAQPGLEKFAEIWQGSGMGQYTLTPVGIAVAHSNSRRLFEDFRAPLSIWVS